MAGPLQTFAEELSPFLSLKSNADQTCVKTVIIFTRRSIMVKKKKKRQGGEPCACSHDGDTETRFTLTLN